MPLPEVVRQPLRLGHRRGPVDGSSDGPATSTSAHSDREGLLSALLSDPGSSKRLRAAKAAEPRLEVGHVRRGSEEGVRVPLTSDQHRLGRPDRVVARLLRKHVDKPLPWGRSTFARRGRPSRRHAKLGTPDQARPTAILIEDDDRVGPSCDIGNREVDPRITSAGLGKLRLAE